MTGKKKEQTNTSGRNWGGSRPNTGRKKAVAAPDPSQASLSTYFSQPSRPSSANPNVDPNSQQHSQSQHQQPQQESETLNDEVAENDAGPTCDEVAAGNETLVSLTINSKTPSIDKEVIVSAGLVGTSASDQQATASTDDD
ncbi:hypothetical protein HDU76_009892, partial [Blyttiomyces sp. JEL0837]